MRRRRCPRSGSLLFTETTDQSRIRAIILVAQQLALAESFDLDWIDDDNVMALLVKINGQSFTVRTRRFQASMNIDGFVFG